MVDIVPRECADPDDLAIGYCDAVFAGFIAPEYFEPEDRNEEEISIWEVERLCDDSARPGRRFCIAS